MPSGIDEIPIETRTAMETLVREVLRKHVGALGRRFSLLREFAIKYWWAHMNNVDWYKKDLIEAYMVWGIEKELLEAVAREIEERYGKK
jgi:hypothetical protein